MLAGQRTVAGQASVRLYLRQEPGLSQPDAELGQSLADIDGQVPA